MRSAANSSSYPYYQAAGGFECEPNQRPPHFLDSCYLCRKQLSQKSDIYMYRGDTPFCSQECRQEQIEMDEANEKRLKVSKRRSQKESSSSAAAASKESDANKAVRTGTVAVA